MFECFLHNLFSIYIKKMVLVSQQLLKIVPKLRKSEKIGGIRFIDKLRIHVSGGAGGQGLKKLGGYGGAGGNIYAVADETWTLKRLFKKYPHKRLKAGLGGDSRKNLLAGLPGNDLEIFVPYGVRVLTEEGRLLGELNLEGDKVLLARGGPGGTPLNGFLGRKGDSRVVILDLKLIADVGLVGFPNAGKSTILKALSRASPKIANYPFTTIRPQLGTIEFDDLRQITVADLPGLIEGAHQNDGLGHMFLKHVERTRLLLFVLDPQGFQLRQNQPFRSAIESLLLLNRELELYSSDLVEKPAVLVVNKTDCCSTQVIDELMYQLHNPKDLLASVSTEFHPERLMKFSKIIPISAKTGAAVDKLKTCIRHCIDVESESDTSEVVLHDPLREQTETNPFML